MCTIMARETEGYAAALRMYCTYSSNPTLPPEMTTATDLTAGSMRASWSDSSAAMPRPPLGSALHHHPQCIAQSHTDDEFELLKGVLHGVAQLCVGDRQHHGLHVGMHDRERDLAWECSGRIRKAVRGPSGTVRVPSAMVSTWLRAGSRIRVLPERVSATRRCMHALASAACRCLPAGSTAYTAG